MKKLGCRDFAVLIHFALITGWTRGFNQEAIALANEFGGTIGPGDQLIDFLDQKARNGEDAK